MQTSADEETVQMKSPRGTLEWMEPLYFPPAINQIAKPPCSPEPMAAASLKLPGVKIIEIGPAPLEGEKGLDRKGKGETSRKGKEEQKKMEQTSGKDTGVKKDRTGTDEHGDPSLYAIQDEWRPIEEEIANRILSDISEEGSVASTDDLDGRGKSPSTKLSREQLDLDLKKPASKKDLMVHVEDEGEQTPTKDQADFSAPMLVQGLAQTTLTLNIPDGDKTPTRESTGSPSPGILSPASSGLKSPIRRSPTKEEVMEVIIKTKRGKAQSLPSPELAEDMPEMVDGIMPQKAKQSKQDAEFDRLMTEVEEIKADVRRRRKEIEDGHIAPPDFDTHRRRRDFGLGLDLPPHPEVEFEDYEWDSNYQTGPETYLMSLRDPGLTARVRDYRRAILGDSAVIITGGYIGERNLDIAVRERRRYTDVVREDLGVQKSASFMGEEIKSSKIGAIRRVRSDVHVPPPPAASCLKRPSGGGFAPVFQTRLRETVFSEDSSVSFHCSLVGDPQPEISWYHNDSAITPGARHTFSFEHNKASLYITLAYFADAGVYTCCASNKHGTTNCSARLKMGDLPSRPTRPDVELASDTEVFMIWEPPTSLGGLKILGYKLEYRKAGENDYGSPWHLISDTIDEEAVIVRHLEPMGIYQFRVTGKNCFGWGEPSLSSRTVRTHPKGVPKLNVEVLKSEHHLNIVTFVRQLGTSLSEIPEEVEGSAESTPAPDELGKPAEKQNNGAMKELNESDDPSGKYQLESELFRGRFCLIRNAVDKDSENAAHCVAKIILATPDLKDGAKKEFELLRTAQHEHVVTLLTAYLRNDFVLLFQERLTDTLLQRFTYRDNYTEDQISRTISQMVSALQWIHFKGLVHLDVQPENIMFTGKRSWFVKLVDFGSAVQLSADAPTFVPVPERPDYAAPELLKRGPVSPLADCWGVGLITYILLSGMHPFATEEDSKKEVARNVIEDRCDLDFIHTNASEESLRFLTWALKKQPNRRMSTEEALNHRWLSAHDTMGRRRENIKFPSSRLRKFAIWYRSERVKLATDNNQLLSTYGTSTT